MAPQRRLAGSALLVAVALVGVGCSSEETPVDDAAPTSEAPSTSVPAPKQVIDLPSDLSGTEGIAIDPVTRSIVAGEWGRGRIVRGQLPDADADPGAPVQFETFVDAGTDGRFDVVGLAVDADRRRLVAAGGNDPHVYVSDIDSGALVAKVPLQVAPGSYLNDVGIGPAGEIFVTLSGGTAAMFQVFLDDGEPRAEVFVDYSSGTPIPTDTPGRLLNGIVVEAEWILTVHTATGQLFRIDRATREIVEVDVGAEQVGRDGLALIGDTLLAVDIQAYSGLDHERITVTELDPDRRSGEVIDEIRDEEFRSPTTLGVLDGRLFVVNAKFGLPESERPFTIFSLPLP
jgi:Cu-Zn family superoxide dismutase